MTLFDVLKSNRELIERLHRAGIRPADAAYIDLFEDFLDMVAAGVKVSYAVETLAARHGVCVRKVYAIIRRFKARCTF